MSVLSPDIWSAAFCTLCFVARVDNKPWYHRGMHRMRFGGIRGSPDSGAARQRRDATADPQLPIPLSEMPCRSRTSSMNASRETRGYRSGSSRSRGA
jgi:hypothetical protein